MWEYGRQGTGYLKKKLFENSFLDCWLIKYPPNTTIPPHTDKVEGKKHFRLNIVVKGYAKFESDTPPIFNLLNRIIFFRPDINKHWVNNKQKERIILSLGWVLRG